MDPHYDVAIVGGGVIGVCSAYYLASKGLSVVLIEKGEIASGCSYGNGGLIVPSDSIPLASPGALGAGLRWLLDPESPLYIKPRLSLDLVRWLLRFVSNSRESVMLRSMSVLHDLLFRSAALYNELARMAGFAFGYEDKGTLWVCLSQDRLEREKKEIHLFERLNVPVQVLSQSEVHELEPALLPQVAGGVYYPSDGHIDPRQFVVGLAEKAEQQGVTTSTNTEVMGFEISNRKVTSLRTTRGDIQAKQVVLAAGSWTPHVARALKLRIPIQPAKGYSITLENPDPAPKLPLLFSEARVVVNPLGDALRLAGSLELAGIDFSFDSRRIERIRRASNGYLPGLQDAKVNEIWRGLRPCTPDGLPVIGRLRQISNVIVAAGHAMLGMSLGPITGKLVSQLVCGEKTAVDLAPLRLERF